MSKRLEGAKKLYEELTSTMEEVSALPVFDRTLQKILFAASMELENYGKEQIEFLSEITQFSDALRHYNKRAGLTKAVDWRSIGELPHIAKERLLEAIENEESKPNLTKEQKDKMLKILAYFTEDEESKAYIRGKEELNKLV